MVEKRGHVASELVAALRSTPQTRRRMLKRAVAMGLAAPALRHTRTTRAQTETETAEANPRFFGFEIVPPAQSGGVMIWGIDTPVLVDWSLLTGGWTGLSEGLVQVDPNTLEVAPLLAESWESNADATEWTFSLRRDVLFHDGEPFTAGDVKYTFEMHAAEDNAAAVVVDSASAAQRIGGVDVVDDHTVRVMLTQPNFFFPDDTLLFPIVAAHLLRDVPAAELLTHPSSTGTDPAQVVFTGPFKFQEHVDGEQMTLVRFDDYWDGAPALDSIVFRVIPDQSAQAAQLLTGDLDASTYMDPGLVRQFEGTDLTVYTVPRLYFRGYTYNLVTEDTPYYGDERVRHALLHAIDREQIVESVYFGLARVQETIFPPGFWANDEENVSVRYPYDPERAKQLLDEAGWIVGANGIREKDGVELRPRLMGTAGDSTDEALVVTIQEYWRAVNVELVPDLATDPEQTARVVDPPIGEKDFDSALWFFGWDITVDCSFNFGCTPTMGGGNRYNYCNERVDELQQQILAEPDREKLIDLMTEMQDLILADLPVAPIVQWVDARPVHNRFRNVYPNSANPFFNCETWWIEG